MVVHDLRHDRQAETAAALRPRRLLIASPEPLALDALMERLRMSKGAASQAVQCFNLMVNLPETEGLL